MKTSSLESHPTVQAVGRRPRRTSATPLSGAELRQLCLEAGADDVGFVALERPEMDAERESIRAVFPATRTCISLVCRMNPEPIRTPARSLSNLEFHSTGDELNAVTRRIVTALERRGVRALNAAVGFPMEMDRFPGRVWPVSLKPLAEAAGLGRMGLHRNVIHPRFGNFILLGAVLIDALVDEESRPISYSPCLGCNLCVAACPVGAIAPDGAFNFSSCYTHNYREFMGGFTDWAENVASSGSAEGYRARVSDSESASMWQSLSFGPNYKAAYCLSVCPAGEEVIAPFLDDRAGFVREIVKPLQQKVETIYVRPHSDAEAYVRRRYPHKAVKGVGRVLRPTTIRGFIFAMRHVFQPGQSKGLDAVFHFQFTGSEKAACTVTIRDQKIDVVDGCVGTCDLRVTADGTWWIRFLRGEVGIVRLLLTRRVRLKGRVSLLPAFGKCFP